MPELLTILNYKGPIEFKTTELLLQKVKADLEPLDIKKVLKKRVYNIMVECVENILRHNADDSRTKIHPYISLEKVNDYFLVTAGNLIPNEEKKLLEQRINDVNLLDNEGLHKMYEDQINKENKFEENGAGLGIITIALKSNNKIKCNFYPVDEGLSVFELKVTVSF